MKTLNTIASTTLAVLRAIRDLPADLRQLDDTLNISFG